MNDQELAKRMRELSAPLEPIPAGEEPRLGELEGIRCVLFDIYGTLFISASGEVGAAADINQQDALEQAFSACGYPASAHAQISAGRIAERIREEHQAARKNHVEYPEIDILEIWESLLLELNLAFESRDALKRLAVEYEARTNPVWPMPGMEQVLEEINARRIMMGIVSNAQFYTHLLFPAFTERACADWGFNEELCVWSYRAGEGKPSRDIYRVALSVLDYWGVQPDQVLYVGNDMRNDIAPAHELGCRTALFAGDRRSLRWRKGDPLVGETTPDLVITELTQLSKCLVIG